MRATEPSSARRLYAGVDVGKAHHWVCLLDEPGGVVLSRKVANDETDLAAVIQEVTASGAGASRGPWTSSTPSRCCCLTLLSGAWSGSSVRTAKTIEEEPTDEPVLRRRVRVARRFRRGEGVDLVIGVCSTTGDAGARSRPSLT